MGAQQEPAPPASRAPCRVCGGRCAFSRGAGGASGELPEEATRGGESSASASAGEAPPEAPPEASTSFCGPRGSSLLERLAALPLASVALSRPRPASLASLPALETQEDVLRALVGALSSDGELRGPYLTMC